VEAEAQIRPTDLPAVANQIRAFWLRQISPTGKSLLIFRNRVKPLLQKYFASLPTQISPLICVVLPTEGRAHVTNAVRDAVDAAASGER
jgi:alpha-ketoglutarate-dependent taurine dioxygenase